ncbi:MAG: hypothetical protein Q9210_002650 [Variospora velana]
MTNTFHLSPQASSPLYNLISSPLVHYTLLTLSLLSILLFSITVGYAEKHIPSREGYYDLAHDNHFYEELALGFSFLPFVWLTWLLVWHQVLKKPKIHPGKYVGYDLIVAIPLIAAYAMTTFLSPALFESSNSVCISPPNGPEYDGCELHKTVLFRLAITAYVFAYIMALSAQMGRLNRSTSLDNIIPPSRNGGYGPSGEHAVLETRMV